MILKYKECKDCGADLNASFNRECGFCDDCICFQAETAQYLAANPEGEPE